MVILEEFKWSFSQSHFCAEKLKANSCEELQLVFSCGAWPFSTFSDSRRVFYFVCFLFHPDGCNSGKYINMGCLYQIQEVYEAYEKKKKINRNSVTRKSCMSLKEPKERIRSQSILSITCKTSQYFPLYHRLRIFMFLFFIPCICLQYKSSLPTPFADWQR